MTGFIVIIIITAKRITNDSGSIEIMTTTLLWAGLKAKNIVYISYY